MIMDKVLGFLAPIVIYTIIFILNILLPGRWVTGYVTEKHSDEKLRYHLNGLQVLIVLVFAWFLLGFLNIVPFDWLYTYRWYGLGGAFIQVWYSHLLWSWLTRLSGNHFPQTFFWKNRKPSVQRRAGRCKNVAVPHWCSHA